MVPQSTGYLIQNLTIYTDFGTTKDTTPKPFKVTIISTQSEPNSLENELAYQAGQSLGMTNPPDFSECVLGSRILSFEPKMVKSQQLNCFSNSALFNSGDNCTTRYDKIKQVCHKISFLIFYAKIKKLNETGFFDVQFSMYPENYSKTNSNVTSTISKPDNPIQTGSYCQLPGQVNYQFVYQEKDGFYRLEGVSIG